MKWSQKPSDSVKKQKAALSPSMQAKFDRLLTRAMCQHMTDSSILDSPDWRRVFEYLASLPAMPQVPTGSTFRTQLLPSMVQLIKVGEVQPLLAQCTSVALNFDSWVSDGTGDKWLGVDAHTITELYQPIKVHLGVVPLSSTTPADEIAVKLRALVAEYGLSNKVIATIGDGGSSLQAAREALLSSSSSVACESLDVHIPFDSPCWTHRINEIGRSFWSQLADPKTGKFVAQVKKHGLDVKALFRKLRSMATMFVTSIPRRIEFQQLCQEFNLPLRLAPTDVPGRFTTKFALLYWVKTHRDVLTKYFYKQIDAFFVHLNPVEDALMLADVLYDLLRPLAALDCKIQASGSPDSFRGLCDTIVGALTLASEFSAELDKQSEETQISREDMNPTKLWSGQVTTGVAPLTIFRISAIWFMLDKLRSQLKFIEQSQPNPQEEHMIQGLMLHPQYFHLKEVEVYFKTVLGKSAPEYQTWVKGRLEAMYGRLAKIHSTSAQSDQNQGGDPALDDSHSTMERLLMGGGAQVEPGNARVVAVSEYKRFVGLATAERGCTLDALDFYRKHGAMFVALSTLARGFFCIAGSQGGVASIVNLGTYLERDQSKTVIAQNPQSRIFIQSNDPLGHAPGQAKKEEALQETMPASPVPSVPQLTAQARGEPGSLDRQVDELLKEFWILVIRKQDSADKTDAAELVGLSAIDDNDAL